MSTNEQRINAIGEYLMTRPNGVRKSEIREAYPKLFNQSNTHPDMGKVIRVMRANGWIVETNIRFVALSAKGRQHFAKAETETNEIGPVPAITEPVQRPRPVAKTERGAISRVLSVLPPVQSAYVEMVLSAIVARYHMTERKTFHPSFMAIGETGTGKTSLALVACRMLGLDETQHVHFLARKARGELSGRRVQTPAGWIYERPEEMTLPFVVFDEYDKASEAQRNAANPYFQGSTVLRAERSEYDVLPVPMLIANPPATGDRYSVLRPEYRRRSLIIDTRFMRERRSEVELFISEAYRMTESPVISLDDVTPLITQISDDARTILRSVPELLTDAGREEFPGTPFMETLVFGYCGLYGTIDQKEAAYAVGLAYLRTAETVGHVRENAVSAFDQCADVSDVQEWISTLAGMMRNRSTEIATVRDGASEFAEELNWVGLREQWATYFDDLADELENPPDEWNSRKNRKVYRHAATMMRKIAHACRTADTKTRLSDVLKGSKKWREAAQAYINAWEEYEEQNADEDEDEGEDEVVTAEIVEDKERPGIGRFISELLPAMQGRSTLYGPAFAQHIAKATTLRVRYDLYTIACERCRNDNRRCNGENWAEGPYSVDIVETAHGNFRNTERLCYPCTLQALEEIRSGKEDGSISYGNIYPRIDPYPNAYATYCALCITPKPAEYLVRNNGTQFRDLDRLPVCDGCRMPVHRIASEYGLPIRYDPIDGRIRNFVQGR